VGYFVARCGFVLVLLWFCGFVVLWAETRFPCPLTMLCGGVVAVLGSIGNISVV